MLSRGVYGGVAESSLPLAATTRGQGVGWQLRPALNADSETPDSWTLQAGTFAESSASIGLHTQAGFRVIGHCGRIGPHHGVWRSTGQLERRSLCIGIASFNTFYDNPEPTVFSSAGSRGPG